MWTNFSEGPAGLALAFRWWRYLLLLPPSCDCSHERADLWEELSAGWMREYIWPYDDWYNPRISGERKHRLDQ